MLPRTPRDGFSRTAFEGTSLGWAQGRTKNQPLPLACRNQEQPDDHSVIG